MTLRYDPKYPSEWEILIAGAKDTSYEGGVFRLSCRIPTDYPFKPPSIRFVTRIYHPSVVKNTGGIDPSFYTDNWMPSWTIKGLIQLIIERFFLKEIDVNSPIEAIEPAIVDEYMNNRALFNKNAADWTRKYATPEKED